VGAATHHLVALGHSRSRIVSTPTMAPEGDCTRMLSVSGNQGESGFGTMPPPVYF